MQKILAAHINRWDIEYLILTFSIHFLLADILTTSIAMGELFKYRLGLNEFTSKDERLIRALLAEFVAIFMLNFFGCMSATHGTHTMISLTFGFVVFAGIMVSEGGEEKVLLAN